MGEGSACSRSQGTDGAHGPLQPFSAVCPGLGSLLMLTETVNEGDDGNKNKIKQNKIATFLNCYED